MSSAILTGRWIGHYLDHGKEFPITADVLEDRERLSGFMYDGQQDRDCSVAEAIAEAGMPPGSDEQIEAKLREMVPGAPPGPIRWVSHLPSNSILRGQRTGATVSFVKSYQGTSYSGYQVGDRLIGMRKADHQVHYRGQLSPDGLVLEGRWWINADPVHGQPTIKGLFQLRRAEAEESQSAGGPGTEKKRPWWRFW